MRADEIHKYSVCYRQANYGMGKRNRLRAKKDIKTIPKGSTYLDVGCGRGETLEMAERRGIDAKGIEIVPFLCDGDIICASITDIPFGECYFDYVSAYDVLEHLPPEDVEKALDELWRVTKSTCFITTNNRRSAWNGHELHLTRKPREWWSAQFHKRGFKTAELSTFATEGDWHWRITMMNSGSAQAEK